MGNFNSKLCENGDEVLAFMVTTVFGTLLLSVVAALQVIFCWFLLIKFGVLGQKDQKIKRWGSGEKQHPRFNGTFRFAFYFKALILDATLTWGKNVGQQCVG